MSCPSTEPSRPAAPRSLGPRTQGCGALRLATALTAGALLSAVSIQGPGCSASQDRRTTGAAAGESQPPSTAAGGTGVLPRDGDSPDATLQPESGEVAARAQVDALLLAHRVRPGETLEVRLLGTIGPDGSWALDSIEVRQEPGRVVIEPRIRRVAGDFFIQMVIPLDHTVSLELQPGDHRIEVLARQGVLVDTVTVTPDARRAPPTLEFGEVRPWGAGAETLEAVEFRAAVDDGWIDRLQIREVSGGRETGWRPPDQIQRVGAALEGSMTVRRPSGDPERRFEARAIDGQGASSQVAEIVLPSR